MRFLQPQSNVVPADNIELVGKALEVPIVDTHWGTRMVSATDPDGRDYNFEPRRESP